MPVLVTDCGAQTARRANPPKAQGNALGMEIGGLLECDSSLSSLALLGRFNRQSSVLLSSINATFGRDFRKRRQLTGTGQSGSLLACCRTPKVGSIMSALQAA